MSIRIEVVPPKHEVILPYKVVDFEQYSVSNMGYIIGPKGIPIYGTTNKKGYKQATLYAKSNKHRKYVLIHILVAQLFVPNPNKKPQVNHLSGVKTCNWCTNLEWATGAENMQHCSACGLEKYPTGTHHYKSKFTDQDVFAILDRYALGGRGNGYIAIAKDYGVSHPVIRNIVKGIQYKELVTEWRQKHAEII